MARGSTESPVSLREAVALSAAMAMIATAVEFLASAVFLATSERALYQGADVTWAKPLANMTLVVAIGVITSRISRPLFFVAITFPVVAAPLLVLFSGSSGPLLLFAAGLSVQAKRLIEREDRSAGIVRIGKVLAATYASVALIVLGLQFRREHAGRAVTADVGAPNVLLLILDTVRRPSMNEAGGRAATPFLDSLAGTGVVFDRAISASSWTLPSHASMFTGLWPHEHKATDWESSLDERAPTLAEAFDSAGYRTGGFVANLIYGTREHGLDRGFQVYRDYPRTPGAILRSASMWQTLLTATLVRRLTGFHDVVARKDAADINDEFLDWVDRGDSGPWFAFLNYFDAHEPYVPRRPFAGRYSTGLTERVSSRLRFWSVEGGIREWNLLDSSEVRAEQAAYEESITGLDAELGALFDQLRSRGALENTLVILTSDHGEQFGERSAFTHGGSLHWRSIHVPLLITWPGHLPSGQRIEAPVSLRDLAATIQGLALPDAAPLPGVPLAGPKATGNASIALSELRRGISGDLKADGLQSVAGSDWQYIRSAEGREQVYRISDSWLSVLITDSLVRAAIIDSARERLSAARVRMASR